MLDIDDILVLDEQKVCADCAYITDDIDQKTGLCPMCNNDPKLFDDFNEVRHGS